MGIIAAIDGQQSPCQTTGIGSLHHFTSLRYELSLACGRCESNCPTPELWGGPPGPQADALVGLSRTSRHLVSKARSGSTGTRVDQGVRRTIYAAFPVMEKLCGIKAIQYRLTLH